LSENSFSTAAFYATGEPSDLVYPRRRRHGSIETCFEESCEVDRNPIYLDYNATTPVDPAVADAMLPYLYEHFGNPSSPHAYGTATKRAVELARAQVARCLGCDLEEIFFTSGGSESNNMAIKGVARALRSRGRHIVTSAVEHPAVLEPCEALKAEGYRITVLPVDEAGRVDPADVAAALAPDTILVSIMHANNEVGTIQPVAEIAAIVRKHGARIHTDAAQSVGKVPVNVAELDVDLLTLAGHKLYAPKGVGALYVRSGIEIPSLIHGAGHESGQRAGTENVMEIVGLGKACELAGERLEATTSHCSEMRDRLWTGLTSRLGELRRNGDPDGGLPNTLSVCFRGIDASALLAEIGDRVAASAGAACHAEGVDLSTVLKAMGVPVDYAMGTVRFSVGRRTTADEIDAAVGIVADAVERLGGDATVAVETAVGEGEVELTRFTHGMGCACKLRPQELERVLRSLPPVADPAVLVGTATADDAAVYRLSDELAVVQTVDFFTPIADDPYEFGAISAANSLSDIYAMGARPVFALSVVGFPSNRLPLGVLERILKGASETARDAGIDIIGGHTVEDTEPKFGLAVTGIAHPDRILTNAGARAGDALVLTKPIGTGIVATGVKRRVAATDVASAALAVMRELNRNAAEAMLDVGVQACTDVTGFGLLGHLREMAAASGLDVQLDAGAVPVLEGARELAAADVVPGGTLDNLAHVSEHVEWPSGFSKITKVLLADAQTSGGLLIAVSADRSERLVDELRRRNVTGACAVGRFTGGGPGRIRVLPAEEV
jgi:cysteine desulfurase NifS/selenium donor protein